MINKGGKYLDTARSPNNNVDPISQCILLRTVGGTSISTACRKPKRSTIKLEVCMHLKFVGNVRSHRI